MFFKFTNRLVQDVYARSSQFHLFLTNLQSTTNLSYNMITLCVRVNSTVFVVFMFTIAGPAQIQINCPVTEPIKMENKFKLRF